MTTSCRSEFVPRRTEESADRNSHGYGVTVMHRPVLVKALYGALSEADKSRILLKKRVVSVDVSEDGVKVACDDGSVEEGSIVIGADGVRSNVRLCMRALKAGKQPDELPEEQKRPYKTTYRCYFGNVGILPGLGTNKKYDGAHARVSTQLLIGDDRSWFAVYEAIDTPTTKHARYTDEDKAKVLEKWGHLYFAPGCTA
jgi:2-polyprenyl-6-methoxyphenol hydroxylase-like FAD-dependent oxidoreductase